MRRTDLRHLEFLSRTEWGRRHLKELLYFPDAGLWQSLSVDEFSDAYGMLTSRLGPLSEIRRMLDLHLATEALLQRREAPDWFIQWISDHLDVNGYAAPLDWQTCLAGQWHAGPVLLVNEKAYVRYFIVGLAPNANGMPLWPHWADGLMDDRAKTAVQCAVRACHVIRPPGPGLAPFLYPLALPNRRVQITGTSLGLSIALGIMGLLNNERLSEDVLASGAVLPDGSISKVGRLSAKTACAGKLGFRIFLFPLDNRPPSQTVGIKCLPVSDLGEAWTLARIYAPGQGKRLSLMANMLADPVTFIDNCTAVPFKWLEWARENGKISHVRDMALHAPDFFEALVNKADHCISKGDMTRGRILAACAGPEAVERLKHVVPVSVFRWLTLNLAIANHMGDVASARMWENEAEAMVRQASMTDAESFANFCNHRVVGLSHNRYQFEPELPPIVKRVLNALESQYRSQGCVIENPVNETLGAFYGTLAQNCGFCGPRHLAETQRYAALSRKAFGDGKAPELKPDWLRPYNYAAYACLDAREWTEAERNLLAYLQMEDWVQLWALLPGLSQWQHALLARFFADCETREEGLRYREWASRNQDHMVKQNHPWQLWCFNMGRVNWKTGRPDSATGLFRRSLEICLHEGMGPTVQVMALLPLSGLWKAGGLVRLEMASMEKKIRRAAVNLNAVHFDPLLRQPVFTKVLESVWERPETMFPFTYR